MPIYLKQPPNATAMETQLARAIVEMFAHFMRMQVRLSKMEGALCEIGKHLSQTDSMPFDLSCSDEEAEATAAHNLDHLKQMLPGFQVVAVLSTDQVVHPEECERE